MVRMMTSWGRDRRREHSQVIEDLGNLGTKVTERVSVKRPRIQRIVKKISEQEAYPPEEEDFLKGPPMRSSVVWVALFITSFFQRGVCVWALVVAGGPLFGAGLGHVFGRGRGRGRGLGRASGEQGDEEEEAEDEEDEDDA
jgi:hypothetical protein